MFHNRFEPASCLDGHAREAWFRYLPVLRKHDAWENLYKSMFEVLCGQYGLVKRIQEERRMATFLMPSAIEEHHKKDKVLEQMEREAVDSLRGLAVISVSKSFGGRAGPSTLNLMCITIEIS